MLISKELTAAMNEEIGLEFFASNQYVAMAAYFDNLALPKLSKAFLKQADEERGHAMKFIKYLMDTGGHVAIPDVKAPKSDFATVEEAVKISLDWELEVTRRCNALYKQAVDENDYAAQDFLRWFVTEQIEEVSTMDNLLKVVKAAGERSLIVVEAYLVHGS